MKRLGIILEGLREITVGLEQKLLESSPKKEITWNYVNAKRGINGFK